MEHFRGLPFKVGELVELKSFDPGYRGAWFPCEIKGTGKSGVAVDLYGYPDDGVIWMKSLYEKVPYKSSRGSEVELMLRPQFPPLHKGEAPDLNSISEVIVVKNGVWKVGDLVDWFCDGAYWSGTIIRLLEEDKAKVMLHPTPVGEGMEYEALCTDLRPSLNWSPESGWTVAVPRGKDNYCPCAQLIKPVNEGTFNEKSNGSCSGLSCKEMEAAETERVELKQNIPLNSSKWDSIEASLMDLEELLNRIKWMKRILEPPQPNAANAGWEFQEY